MEVHPTPSKNLNRAIAAALLVTCNPTQKETEMKKTSVIAVILAFMMSANAARPKEVPSDEALEKAAPTQVAPPVVGANRNSAPAIRLGTGKEGGGYNTVGKDIALRCNQYAQISVEVTGGSDDNISRYSEGRLNMLITQTDVARLAAGSGTDLSGLKTLVPLHTEMVHVLTPSVPTIKVGGVGPTHAFGSDLVVSSWKSLKGQKVIAIGGSAYTADLINSKLGLGWIIDDTVKNIPAALEKMKKGEAAALLQVQVFPVKEFASLPKNEWKFVPAEPLGEGSPIAKFYVSSKLSYLGKGDGMQGVPALGVQSLLVVSDTKNQRMLEAYTGLRSCIKRISEELAEDTSDSNKAGPAWKSINANIENNAVGSWPVMNLPEAKSKK